MKSPSEYATQVHRILGVTGNGTVNLHADTPAEARKLLTRIRQMQKELRLLKKEIGLTTKELRSSYTTQKTQVGKGFGAGLFAGFFGKKTAGRINAVERDSVRVKQQNALAPYEKLSHQIDDLLLQMDRAKIEFESLISEGK